VRVEKMGLFSRFTKKKEQVGASQDKVCIRLELELPFAL
jgi:hypothetical protein